MPTWLKYAIFFFVGWLFGAGIVTIQMVANAIEAVVTSLTAGIH